ncbi:N-acetylglucosamine-binding protein GbpA [Dyella subtropica]|uniref:N-acetylglucosamine-binding protein GbpA n=1 Tax=Dyella subtropica TaxID=2992127 RepID=UPI00224E92D5|nr:N-acetylglucosamine-binding protein GbpA [Dyella subtropica]
MKTRIDSYVAGARREKFLLLGLLAASTAALTLLPTNKAEAHGYISSPKSRAVLCSAIGGNVNTNCGSYQYEPQSIEYHPQNSSYHYPSTGAACSGSFVQCGPANGWIASGGNGGSYGGINEQTATRWHKNRIAPGQHTFTWTYTARHPVAYQEFYITKNGWNPNEPLSRDSFELTPIAHFDGGNVMPGPSTDRQVTIPADHSGYHVILATWKVADTPATFYQVIDVDIDNGTPPEWNIIGSMHPEPLLPGDKVGVRVFTNQGDQTPPGTMLTIDSEELGQANVWPHALATQLNRMSNALRFSTGVLNDEGRVVPNYGQNNFYVRPDSKVTRVEVVKHIADMPTTLRLTGLQDSYTIADGQVNLHFNAIAEGNESYTINATVFDAKGTPVAYKEGAQGDSSPHFMIALKDAAPGTYDIAAVATVDGESKAQAAHRFIVEQPAGGGDYDHVFPAGLGQYTAGTKVLQPKDGKVYECRPFPESGFCKQWSSSANAFEPGVGHAWQSAWIRK